MSAGQGIRLATAVERVPPAVPGSHAWGVPFLEPGEWVPCMSDPDLFFPEPGASRDARVLCASCHVRAACADYAVGQDLSLGGRLAGVWGGLTETDRDGLVRAAGDRPRHGVTVRNRTSPDEAA